MMDKEKEIAALRKLCFDAVQLRGAGEAAKLLRARRLLCRREYEYARLKKNASSAREFRDVSGKAAPLFSAALALLVPGKPVEPEKPDASPCGRRVFVPCDPDADVPFDGKRTAGEIALEKWAFLPFLSDEPSGAYSGILSAVAAFAERGVKEGTLQEVIPHETKEDELLADFRRGGIVPGDKVMVHASVRSLGRISGGAQSVISALQRAVGENGILAMPALSDTYDDAGCFEYDPATTPVVPWIGVLPRIFRETPGVVRSANPTHSVLAWGKDAVRFVDQSDPYDCFAPDGPWAKLREQNGKILLIGESAVDSNTFLHACEAWYNFYLESIVVRVRGAGKKTEIHFPGGCRGNWYHLGVEAPYFQKLATMKLVHSFPVGGGARNAF